MLIIIRAWCVGNVIQNDVANGKICFFNEIVELSMGNLPELKV